MSVKFHLFGKTNKSTVLKTCAKATKYVSAYTIISFQSGTLSSLVARNGAKNNFKSCNLDHVFGLSWGLNSRQAFFTFLKSISRTHNYTNIHKCICACTHNHTHMHFCTVLHLKRKKSSTSYHLIKSKFNAHIPIIRFCTKIGCTNI